MKHLNIISFIFDNGTEFHKRHTATEIIKTIDAHLLYKTCIIIYDFNDDVKAYARWNISKDGTTAHILDAIVDKKYRNKKTLKQLIKYAYTSFSKAFPEVKYISYEREQRKDMRMRKYKISELING